MRPDQYAAAGYEPVWTIRGPKWVRPQIHRALTGRYRHVPLSSGVRAYLDAQAYLWVPQKGVMLVQHNTGSVGTATPGTGLTTDAVSAATKGAAAEIIAATNFDAFWVTILASNYGASATASQGAMDLLGGATTEEVLIADLLMGQASPAANPGAGPRNWDFPLYIPAGTRLAGQAAGERLAVTMQIWVYLYGGEMLPHHRLGGKVTTYGMGTVPTGTALTPGTSGAEGSWTQITASTNVDHFAFLPSFQYGTDTNVNERSLAVDVGSGSATEELLGEYWFQISAQETMGGPKPSLPVFADVPGGTRLVMRASNSGTNDTGHNGVIHAVS